MKLDVTVTLQDTRWKAALKPYCKTVEDVCESALLRTPLAKKKTPIDMAVVLTDDKTIRLLNRDYRGMDKPTNVLSFPSGEAPPKKGVYALGDVILSYDTLEREAKAQGKPLRQHAVHLLVHGTLHLLGFDHDNDKTAARMERLEIKILHEMGIRNPYL